MSSKRSTSGPIIFGEAALPSTHEDVGHHLFGWYHAPERPAKNGGVVLCNPFGYEAMCLHRAYRVLAERIAASGIPTLRFDYHGTGDSSGSDHDPDRVAAWLRSIGAAIEELRRRADITEVSLFGVRFGGTLAAIAGAERKDLASVVLWSPYVTGRAFVREMRMMQSAGAEQAFAAGTDRGASPSTRQVGRALDGEEAIGYLLRADTVADISAIDLRARPLAPAPRVLLLGRDDLPEDARLARHLVAAGVDVSDLAREGHTVAGYAAMMQDAYLSKVPEEAFERVVNWLSAVHSELAPVEENVDRPTLVDFTREGPALVAQGVDAPPDRCAREEAFTFGPTGQLLGILCEPAERGPARTTDAVLFLNVGSNHRVGSNRMYVRMARTLAARGITSLRFDVSGIGDSASAKGVENRLYAKEAIDDVRAAMDKLASLREVERFFLIGLCSGAYLAFKTAHADPRVSGQVLINTQTFSWKEGDTLDVSLRKNFRSTRFYTTEMWNPSTWKRVLRGEVNAKGIAETLGRRAVDRALRSAQGTLARVRHGRLDLDEVAAEFKDVLKRGAETLLVFGANDGGLDLMESHLGPAAKKLSSYSNFRLEIVEGSDHTFTPLWSQIWLEKLIVSALEGWRASDRSGR